MRSGRTTSARQLCAHWRRSPSRCGCRQLAQHLAFGYDVRQHHGCAVDAGVDVRLHAPTRHYGRRRSRPVTRVQQRSLAARSEPGTCAVRAPPTSTTAPAVLAAGLLPGDGDCHRCVHLDWADDHRAHVGNVRRLFVRLQSVGLIGDAALEAPTSASCGPTRSPFCAASALHTDTGAGSSGRQHWCQAWPLLLACLASATSVVVG